MGAGDSATSSLEVCVLGTFRFWAEGSALPAVLGGSQRLLALLSLRDRALMRASVAGTLWPESTEEHAYSSLRSALGRLTRFTRDAVVVTPLDLCLADDVTRRHPRVVARSRIACSIPASALPEADLSADAIAALSLDVLPDWYDDWVLVEAEEWRQLRLHALDALADRLLTERRFGEATGAALAAVRAEPLRESARAAGDPGAPRRREPVRGARRIRAVSNVAAGRARPGAHRAPARPRRAICNGRNGSGHGAVRTVSPWPSQRTGLLIIRAWIEVGSVEPFARSVPRHPRHLDRHRNARVTLAQPDTVVELVETWLEGFLGAAAADG